MNLGELEAAINLALDDRSLAGHITAWINEAILQLAAAFYLPALKLRTPYPLSITTSDWLFDLPANYHRGLFRCADENYQRIAIKTRDALDAMDLDHSETGDRPTAVATLEDGNDGNQIAVYPKATNTIYLWFFERPTVLVKSADKPTCIPDAFHSRVIVPKVVLKGFRHLQDQVENFDPRGIQMWQGELTAGLRGSPVDGPGLIHYLSQSQGGSKRRGGRDPVGARYYA